MSSHCWPFRASFLTNLMDPEFPELGLLQDALVPTGLPWTWLVTVSRIMSRSCWVRVMCVSQVGSNWASADAAIMNPATIGASVLTSSDIFPSSKWHRPAVQSAFHARKEKQIRSRSPDPDQRDRKHGWTVPR